MAGAAGHSWSGSAVAWSTLLKAAETSVVFSCRFLGIQEKCQEEELSVCRVSVQLLSSSLTFLFPGFVLFVAVYCEETQNLQHRSLPLRKSSPLASEGNVRVCHRW